MRTLTTTSTLVAVLALAMPARAQDRPASPPVQPPQPESSLGDLRHHIYVMEGALARAVDYGAKQLNRQILAAMPGIFMLEGEARARGVHLEGYGVFFDVRVPMMRQSMVWSLRMMLDQNDAATQAAANDLRKYLQGVTDPATRASIERAIKQLERQAAPAAMARTVSPGVMVSDAAPSSGSPAPRPPAASSADSLWAQDPNRAYTEAVTAALVDAMIDYSAPMQIAPEQWLTVAARDDEGRDALAPQDPMEEVVTMIYRIKGGDLQEYRSGRLTRDEVRKRVQITQF